MWLLSSSLSLKCGASSPLLAIICSRFWLKCFAPAEKSMQRLETADTGMERGNVAGRFRHSMAADTGAQAAVQLLLVGTRHPIAEGLAHSREGCHCYCHRQKCWPHLGQSHPHQACHIVAVLIKLLAGLHLLLNELGHARTHAVGDLSDHLQGAAQLQSKHPEACGLQAYLPDATSAGGSRGVNTGLHTALLQ